MDELKAEGYNLFLELEAINVRTGQIRKRLQEIINKTQKNSTDNKKD